MSEEGDKDAKTEEPSEKKIRDAMDKGQVPHSREMGIFASIAGTLIIMIFLLRDAGSRLTAHLGRLMDDAGGFRLNTGADATAFLAMLTLDAARLLLPIVLMLMLGGLAASFVQGLPRVVGTRIAPELSRLSPGKGWARLFGARGAGEFAKVCLKLIGTCLVVLLLLRAQQGAAIDSIHIVPGDLPERAIQLMTQLVTAMGILAAFIAGLDLVLSKRNWHRDLKMTKQEVKDEHKQAEGDPGVKGRFRSIALDRSRRRMIAAVPRATLVIANPTHYAIAICYIRAEGGAPLVVAKGQDLIALKIREIAEANGIPVIEDRMLARALYGMAEVDAHIPPAFYRAVAELIHFLGARAGREWHGASAGALEALQPASDKPASPL